MDAQHNPAQHGEVALITVRGNFLFDPATHRDFLGASLNTGVQRSQVGDIIPQGEMGAQMLVAQHMVGHFETTLTHVKKVSVEVRAAPLSELRVREPKVEELRSVEASMRLDAVASAGFRTSRSKVADWISKGDVRYVWEEGGMEEDVKECVRAHMCVYTCLYAYACFTTQAQLEDDHQGECDCGCRGFDICERQGACDGVVSGQDSQGQIYCAAAAVCLNHTPEKATWLKMLFWFSCDSYPV